MLIMIRFFHIQLLYFAVVLEESTNNIYVVDYYSDAGTSTSTVGLYGSATNTALANSAHVRQNNSFNNLQDMITMLSSSLQQVLIWKPQRYSCQTLPLQVVVQVPRVSRLSYRTLVRRR